MSSDEDERSSSDGSLSQSDELGADIDLIALYDVDDDPYWTDSPSLRLIQEGDVAAAACDSAEDDFQCICGRCSPEQPDECLCCGSVSKVVAVCSDAGIQCITRHALFPDFCTRRELLVVNGGPYRRYNRLVRCLDPNDNRCIRYTAYSCFDQWIWGHLGPRNRRQIPGCVVRTIRNVFPSDTYTGYFS